MNLFREVQYVLDAAIQLSTYKEKPICKQNCEITVVQEIHISRLELKRICYFLFWSIYLGLGVEVWLIPFGIM